MAAAVAAAALALCLVASPGCIVAAGADDDWKGENASSGFSFTASPSHQHQHQHQHQHHLQVSSQQHKEGNVDTPGYGSWPFASGAAADRSRDRSRDRPADRHLRGERRALQGVRGGSANRRDKDQELPALKKKIGIFADAADWRYFPSVEDSTVMFLHIFKCAGSTTRRMMVAWAEAEGHRGAVIAACSDARQEEKICLSHYRLLDEAVQSEIMSRQKVLAGHFLWGFQDHIRRPCLMITALRNPLEVFVSAKQYTHKRKTKTLEQAREYVSKAMVETLESYGAEPLPREAGDVTRWQGHDNGYNQPQIGGFIFRLVGKRKKLLRGELLEAAAAEAVRNLDSFWIVGVVEQYAGFEEVLRRILDPSNNHADVWDVYSTHQFNTSPVGSRNVLAEMDAGLVQHFNKSLALQWNVYEKAVALWSVRCREVLPAVMHQEMCSVNPAPSAYEF
eukprot:g10268.t1